MKKIFLIPVLLLFVCSACEKDTVVSPATATAPPLPPPPNTAPQAVAGSDVRILLPVDSATLHGTYYDTPFDNVQPKWRKISGPNSFVIDNPESMKTKVRNLVKGKYEFELTVTDKGGLTGKDSVIVDVYDPQGNLGVNDPQVADSNKLVLTNLEWIYPWYAAIEVKNVLSYPSPIKVFIQRDFDTSWIEVKFLSNNSVDDQYEYFIETRQPDGAGMYTYGSLYIFYYGSNTTDTPNVRIQF